MEDNEYLQSLKDMLQTSNKINGKIAVLFFRDCEYIFY